MRCAVCYPFVLLLAVTAAGTAPAAKIQGKVYNLPPNFAPITNEVVDVEVRATITGAGGLLVRLTDQFGRPTNDFANGDLIGAGASKIADGSFDVDVPPVKGQPARIVNIEFRRRNKGVTQRLNGFVLDDDRKTPYLMDLTVPDPSEMMPYPFYDLAGGPFSSACPPLCSCPPPRRRLFGR